MAYVVLGVDKVPQVNILSTLGEAFIYLWMRIAIMFIVKYMQFTFRVHIKKTGVHTTTTPECCSLLVPTHIPHNYVGVALVSYWEGIRSALILISLSDWFLRLLDHWELQNGCINRSQEYCLRRDGILFNFPVVISLTRNISVLLTIWHNLLSYKVSLCMVHVAIDASAI